jgi:tRNA 2-thiouridine synthesizing protein A
MHTTITPHIEVDASGLNCPLPLLRLKKALMEINSGQTVKIIATDPAAHLDFGVYIEQTGHTLLHLQRADTKQVFYIQKK